MVWENSVKLVFRKSPIIKLNTPPSLHFLKNLTFWSRKYWTAYSSSLILSSLVSLLKRQHAPSLAEHKEGWEDVEISRAYFIFWPSICQRNNKWSKRRLITFQRPPGSGISAIRWISCFTHNSEASGDLIWFFFKSRRLFTRPRNQSDFKFKRKKLSFKV